MARADHSAGDDILDMEAAKQQNAGTLMRKGKRGAKKRGRKRGKARG
jgi:hypothetical protein